MSDDQGFWSIGAYGNSEVKTPNLDKLASNGIRFDECFCVSPVCSPARASFMTGRIPSQHGVHDWLCGGDTYDEKLEPSGQGKVLEYLQGMTGYVDVLAKAGYVCGLSGKWHLGDSHHPQKGFEFWKTHATGGGPYYNAPMTNGDDVTFTDDYVTNVITDNALAFLDECNDDAPFCLNVHYTAPHSPWNRDNHPTQIWDKYHDECPFESAPKGITPPPWFELLRIPVEDDVTRRKHLSGYYAAIQEMDRNIGRLIEKLEMDGKLDDTIVCFTSDNGMCMGHHGLYGKGNATYPLNMYEESIKVPLVISYPKGMATNVEVDALISHYDFMPTILNYLELDTPSGLPGISFANVLRGDNDTQRDRIVIFDEYGPVRMIRTKGWKLILRRSEVKDELYDLKNDAKEAENLIDDPKYADVVSKLKSELIEWFDRFATPGMDGWFTNVRGDGQVGKMPDSTFR